MVATKLSTYEVSHLLIRLENNNLYVLEEVCRRIVREAPYFGRKLKG